MASRARGADKESKDLSLHLQYGALNLSHLRSYYKQHLAELLGERAGSKTVVLDPQLESRMNVLSETLDYRPFFRAFDDVESLQTLNEDGVFSPAMHVVYLVAATCHNMRLIATHIRKHQASGKQHVYSLLLTPRRTLMCERQLEKEGVLTEVSSIHEFQCELLPLQHDVLSLEDASCFKSLFLEQDPACLYPIARSLMKLQFIYGVFPVVKGKGSQAAKIWALMQRMRRDWPIDSIASSSSPSSSPSLSSTSGSPAALLILDRSIDLIAPLLTPSTYEGLIDEFFTIESNLVELPADLMAQAAASLGDSGANHQRSSSGSSFASPAQSPTSAGKLKTKRLPVTNQDSVFAECRDLPFKSVLSAYLPRKAESLAIVYDEDDTKMEAVRPSAAAASSSLAFYKHFKRAPNELSLLSTHTALSEIIAQRLKQPHFDQRLDVERALVEGLEIERCEEYIEALIAQQAPLVLVLRLLALMSLTQGIRSKKLEGFKRELLQTYGFQHLLLISNLEKIGLFTIASLNKKSTPFHAVKKMLRLVNYDRAAQLHLPSAASSSPSSFAPNELFPSDISYVYAGVAPLLVRLVEAAMRPGWKRMDEIMTLIPGPSFEYRQDVASIFDNSLASFPLPDHTSNATLTSSSASSPANSSSSASTVSGLRGFFGKARRDEDASSSANQQDSKLSPSLSVQSLGSNNGMPSRKQIVCVLFVGGVSLAEINALRALSQRDDADFEYVTLTTSIVNGTTLIRSLDEDLVDFDTEKQLKRSIFQSNSDNSDT